MEYKKVQVWQHLTTVHQIDTKDSKRRCYYNISCGIKLLLNKSDKNSLKKRKKIKKGEQEDTGLGGKGGKLLWATNTCSCELRTFLVILRSKEDFLALNKK